MFILQFKIWNMAFLDITHDILGRNFDLWNSLSNSLLQLILNPKELINLIKSLYYMIQIHLFHWPQLGLQKLLF